MFALLFDPDRRALLARFSGSVDESDLELHKTLRRRFIEQEGSVPTIIDLAAVERILLSTNRIKLAGRKASSLFGESQVVVAAPGSEAFGLARMFRSVREASGLAAPALVETIEDAFRLLDLTDPDFRPWPSA